MSTGDTPIPTATTSKDDTAMTATTPAYTLTGNDITRLRALYQAAPHAGPGAPNVPAARVFAAYLTELRDRGARSDDLAQALGVDYTTVTKAIRRHRETATEDAADDRPPPTHGFCPDCGFLAPLRDGLITWHPQLRVRSGADGQAEEYLSQDPCGGHNQLPDPTN